MRTIINNSNLTLFFSSSTSWFRIPGPLDACAASYWAASQEKLTPVKFNKKKRLLCQKLAAPQTVAQLYTSRSTTNQPSWSSPLMGLFVFILRFSPFRAFSSRHFPWRLLFLMRSSVPGINFYISFGRIHAEPSWNTRARWWYFNWFHLIAFVLLTSTSSTSSTRSR